MKYFIYLISIIILLGLNLGLFSLFPIRGQLPNLLFLMALCASLWKKDFDFFFISLISGLFLDFFSTGFFGAYTLALLTMSLCLHLFANNVLITEFNWKTLSVAAAFSWLFFSIMVWLYSLAAFKLNLNVENIGFKFFIGGFFPSLFYNLLLLHPIRAVSNFLKLYVDNLIIRGRGVIR